MDTKIIRSRAPTRIDIAGGTLDLWPLFLFLNKPVTINLGIDIYAETTLEISEKSSQAGTPPIRLVSKDQNTEIGFTWKDLEEGKISPPSSLLLHSLFLKFFFDQIRLKSDLSNFNYSLTLTTEAKSPAGAGLGGSSSLSISMIGALASWAEMPLDPHKGGEKFIDIVRDIETRVIKAPAGLQDYYGAMYGGLQVLRWGIGTHQREYLPNDLLPELENRLLLFYSGQSRNSGINNWNMFKGFIDRAEGVQSGFEKINIATQNLESALREKNWREVGNAISAEWDSRKTLAPGISTKEIDLLFAEFKKITPMSGKVCGAGGGGCFFVYIPDPHGDPTLKTRLLDSTRELTSKMGIRPLPFRGVNHGLEVQVHRG